MTKCFSLTEYKNWCYRSTFVRSGLRSSTTDLKEGTIIHCWVPKTWIESKPNLLLIHGLGANALWQWGDIIRHLTPLFNVYVPDLLFFGGSFTTRPERGESFQAQCLMRVLEANSVGKVRVVGLSYGGFIGYSMAAEYGEIVERVVLCCSGVSMEERDLKEGLFPVDLEEAVQILVPQTPERLKQLLGFTLSRSSPFAWLPSCLFSDFIDAMCRDYVEERREMVRAITRGRKLSDLPRISQVCFSFTPTFLTFYWTLILKGFISLVLKQRTLILWGENDQIFPLELAHRLKRHLGGNAELVVIKNAGHAFNVEKAKEFYNVLTSFLIDLKPPAVADTSSPKSQTNNPA